MTSLIELAPPASPVVSDSIRCFFAWPVAQLLLARAETGRLELLELEAEVVTELCGQKNSLLMGFQPGKATPPGGLRSSIE